MSTQRLVDSCFWDDSYIVTLDPSEKLVFLYLLTNPLTSICGVYEIGIRRIAFDTGYQADTVQHVLQRFERDGRCLYRDGWIGMRNWLKHQRVNPSVQKGIERGLAAAPAELRQYVTAGRPQTVQPLRQTVPSLSQSVGQNRKIGDSLSAKIRKSRTVCTTKVRKNGGNTDNRDQTVTDCLSEDVKSGPKRRLEASKTPVSEPTGGQSVTDCVQHAPLNLTQLNLADIAPPTPSPHPVPDKPPEGPPAPPPVEEEPKEKKVQYAPAVSMTEGEHEKLIEQYGRTDTQEAITFLDEYKRDKPYRNKSDYLTIRRWVVTAIRERRDKLKKQTRPGTPEFKERRCPACGAVQATTSRSCLVCGEEMPKGVTT